MALASIQQISEIKPIEKADKIEVAKVLGWEVVVKKGEFKPGDLCVYIEIDTLIPNRSWFKFLFRPGHENDEYTRLRTIKLRGQISQGLVLPIFGKEGLQAIIGDERDGDCFYLGRDLTVILAIQKYEKPTPEIRMPNGQVARTRNFPAFIRKTDEIRIQSEPKLLEELKGKSYYITQKMDGTSATYYKYQGKFGVCSRNLELPNPFQATYYDKPTTIQRIKAFFKMISLEKATEKTKVISPNYDDLNVYWKMAVKYNIESWLPEGYAVQGEICGPGIQENKIGLEETKLFIFNIWSINQQKYEEIHRFRLALAGGDQILCVPQLQFGDSFDYSLEELLELSKGNYPNGTPQEGIVVRSFDQTISFKVINNEFLLKYGE